jgi:hypothetical protein
MTAQIRDLAAYLNQGEIWSSANGDQRISEMDLVYRRRALDWLLRNTEGLLQMYVLEDFMAMDEDPTLADKLRWADIRPYSWIKKTPLFEALAVGIDVRLLRRSGGR